MTDLTKGLLVALAPMLVRWVFLEIKTVLAKHNRLAALSGVATAAQDAVEAVLPTLSATGATHGEIVKAASDAAVASILKDSPEIFSSLEAATVTTLVTGHVQQATTPGGATVALPTLK